MTAPPDLPPGALSAPAALRNREAILSVLTRIAPPEGNALEIASGTGEHIIAYAPAMPGLTWQPSDPDPDRRASIAAWSAEHPAPNLLPPIDLNACAPGWSENHGPKDMIVLVNLIHLISDADTATLLAEIAKALAPGGIAALYGPFLRDGEATSEGDATFHASLRAQDPAIGYKDVIDVAAALTRNGLHLFETVKLPANNLMLCVERKI
ncbi:DUF938 domain-containing protein [Roseobacter sp. HKCCD9010]|uniref:DUF938 domain-containing protein n=1 Tax=unclassified Roseobacter TaxID=196798 RepID=UPI001491D60D|nr:MULTISPECIES: DUF938 domain-containing protein [unclassified Roseobacter]MBF9049084.1 DUF938 domain-containing protein [Rhodobacterales bacterium HKCCD4356]NNV11084.1 DUF938 domain-containing protein [Roseobacter sp. HKCCD7357]NNV15268.1 DUF938 domain-containing protein [Roseobacter sp. HKCCD8768]NNV24728.1 DUF938 domain-containing protein [Roseobacter sp. HKCCD8192]NNV28984.1 DUF938 domain-containing protein [Roseobacter sp. HKCCD9061]